jgi:hypothetical protein
MSVCVIEGRVRERMNDQHDPHPSDRQKGGRAQSLDDNKCSSSIMFLSDEKVKRSVNSRVQINVSVVNAKPRTQRSVVTKNRREGLGRLDNFNSSVRDLMSEQPLSRGLRRPSRS